MVDFEWKSQQPKEEEGMLFIGAQEIEPLPLTAPGVSGWRTPESPAGPDTPACAGRTLRSSAEAKVSGDIPASIRF